MLSSATITGCCTAQVFYNFGGTPQHPLTPAGTYESIDGELAQLERTFCSKAFLVAFLNNDQKLAAKVLRGRGWRKTKAAQSQQHKTKVTLWWKCPNP